MSTTEAPRRPGQGARRFGYVLAVLLNAVALVLIHLWPGWDVVPFLTDRTRDVLSYVDASIGASIAANVIYLARDDRAFKALGDLVTSLVSLLSVAVIWQVFPFDFTGVWGGWQPLTYVALGVAAFGAAIGAAAQAVALIGLAAGHRSAH